MILPSIDDFLIGKDIGKYTLELEPEKAFGNRTPTLIKTMPSKVFYEQKINPRAGMVFNFDGMMGKITVVSGGRVMVDFNHPLSNKSVIYELNVKRKVEDEKEKASVLIEFMFKRKLNFEIKDKKVIIEIETKFQPIIAFFSEKFKEIIGLELEIKQESKKDSGIPAESANSEEHAHGPDGNHEHEETPVETPNSAEINTNSA
jgi:FKBP-type peptidyl-prolyl cis-trans isomerase SlyD